MGTASEPLHAREQESAELRLPIDMQELNGAAQQERGGGSLAKAEVMLEMRAQLSTSMPWAPMVCADASLTAYALWVTDAPLHSLPYRAPAGG